MTSAALSPTVTQLADDVVNAFFDGEPVFATLFGIHDRDAELPDLTEAAEAAQAERLRGIAAAARAADRAGLTADDRFTLDVAAEWADVDADRYACRQPEWQVADRWHGPAGTMLTYLPLLTLPEPAHAEAYLRRLAGLDRFLAAAAERHRAGIAAGRPPVARLVQAAIQQVDGYLGGPDDDPLAQPAPPADWAGADAYRRDLAEVLAGTVRPAFRRYRDALVDDMAPHGRDDEHVGLCWLPDGADLYTTLVRCHTTSTRTPEELHRTGLELVARLAEEYAKLGGRVFGSTDAGEVMRRLRDDPALRCTSAEQMLTESREAIARAEAAAPAWFARVPEQRCEVQPVPPAEAGRGALASYLPAALDGTRPGTYHLDTSEPGVQPRHVLQFTAYHEAVPGHHFQSALAQSRHEAPLLHRIAQFTAHDEGWALYCERLADEMGLYTDDLARLGMLAGDSMRSCRLVVDTGMHALGWSRTQAADYLRANTPMPHPDVEREIDRYIADPGQALAYMVGRLEIQRLRADAERRLGGRFDIRAFHDMVLGAGSMPLTVLAAQVEAWPAD